MSWENVKIKGTLLFEFLEYDGFPGGLDNKGVYLQCRRSGFDPGLGRPLGEGNGNALQYSCL